MLAQVQSKDFNDMADRALRDARDLASSRFSSNSLDGASLNASALENVTKLDIALNQISTTQVKTGYLVLEVKYYCNGELKQTNVTLLDT